MNMYMRCFTALLLLGICQGVQTEYELQAIPSYAVANTQPSKPAVLECILHGMLDDPDMFVWQSDKGPNGQVQLEAIQERILLQKDRFKSSLNVTEDGSKKMVLTIHPVEVKDQGTYTCTTYSGKFSNKHLSGTVELYVNRLPEVSVEGKKKLVEEGKVAIVATCQAGNSKPAPKMWFEDKSGKKIASESSIAEQCNSDFSEKKGCGGVSSYTLHLEKKIDRSDVDKVYICKIQHANRTKDYSLEIETKLDVQYPASVKFADQTLTNSLLTRRRGDFFAATCLASGNPIPEVSWRFSADKTTSNSSEPESWEVPRNFQILQDGRGIPVYKLLTTNISVTNNGTYTCFAFNGLGPQSTVSFHLQVSETPLTIPSTSTPVVPTEAQLHHAGVDTAVIAGVIAVVVFILIVTVVLLLRHFMSHKGEYYTNELKAQEEVASEFTDDDDVDDLPRTEADLLGEKKRTEHFL